MSKPVVIGIAGGTGSGKTTITKALLESFGKEITIIPQDSYYKSFHSLPFEERAKINYDHPNSIDNDLLVKHIEMLTNKVPVEMPMYDFKTHIRSEKTMMLNPTQIIIIEGILIFENEKLRNKMDIRIFVDTDADIRILRRIERDMSERGRSLESIMEQYRETVRPMHIEFIEPSKRFADVIIPEGGYNKIGIDMLISQIKTILH